KVKNVALGLSRATDGGRTWTAGGSDHPSTLVSAFQGEGKARGSNGQFPDHESITVANDGTIYVPWAHFTGFSGHSPIFIAVSRDGGTSFALPVKVSSGSVRSDQDARVVVDNATGYAYLTFDNSVQGGKGTAMFVSVSTAPGDRINVELSVEPSSGRLDLMTNDRSYTGNTLFDVSYITSADGGSTWSTTRVTKTSWDPSAYGVPCSGCANGVRPFIGDYDGIISLPTS